MDACLTDSVSVPLNGIVVNAGTLRDLTKRASYLEQCTKRKIHFGAAIEPRGRKHGITVDRGYVIVESKCDEHGSGGLIVVVSLKLTFAQALPNCSLPLGVADPDVNLIIAEAQLILVRITAPRFQAVIVAVHGPNYEYCPEHCAQSREGVFSSCRSLLAA